MDSDSFYIAIIIVLLIFTLHNKFGQNNFQPTRADIILEHTKGLFNKDISFDLFKKRVPNTDASEYYYAKKLWNEGNLNKASLNQQLSS